MPLTMISMPTMPAATSMAYCTAAIAGVFTDITEQANPNMRSPNTASTAQPIAKPRLWRVVRGVPRKAKVRIAKANG